MLLIVWNNGIIRLLALLPWMVAIANRGTGVGRYSSKCSAHSPRRSCLHYLIYVYAALSNWHQTKIISVFSSFWFAEKSQVIHEPQRLEDSQEEAHAYTERVPAAALTVRGTKFEVQTKQNPNKSSYNRSRKPQTPQRMAKIRNYNIKD